MIVVGMNQETINLEKPLTGGINCMPSLIGHTNTEVDLMVEAVQTAASQLHFQLRNT